jgi:hypothetical protein
MDLRPTILAKSDQLNAEDLAVPIKITITAVREGSKDQPVWVHYEGDNGRPWKPCKGMRRVLVALWGPDGRTYVGRQLGLFCDPEVEWGGIAVGGVRIAAMSHIDNDTMVEVKVGRGKAKKKYLIKALPTGGGGRLSNMAREANGNDRQAKGQPSGGTEDRVSKGAKDLIERISKTDPAKLGALLSEPKVREQRDWLREERPGIADAIDEAIEMKRHEGKDGPQQRETIRRPNPFDDDDAGAGDSSNGQQQDDRLGPESWDAGQHMDEIDRKELVSDINSYVGKIDFSFFTKEAEDAIRMHAAEKADKLSRATRK